MGWGDWGWGSKGAGGYGKGWAGEIGDLKGFAGWRGTDGIHGTGEHSLGVDGVGLGIC